jgi:hypothetical protein
VSIIHKSKACVFNPSWKLLGISLYYLKRTRRSDLALYHKYQNLIINYTHQIVLQNDAAINEVANWGLRILLARNYCCICSEHRRAEYFNISHSISPSTYHKYLNRGHFDVSIILSIILRLTSLLQHISDMFWWFHLIHWHIFSTSLHQTYWFQ